MPSTSAPDNKNTQFKPTSKKEWTAAATQELGKDNSIEKLVHTIDGIEVLPYYDATDAPRSFDFQLPVSQNEFSEPRSWANMPRITTSDVAHANAEALHALNNGADGVLFDLVGNPDVPTLFNKIELPYCQVAFLSTRDHEVFFQGLCSWANVMNYDTSAIPGAIFWKDDHLVSHGLRKRFEKWHQFAPAGIIGGNATSPSDEISTLLAKAIKQINATKENEGNTRHALATIAFSTSIGTDFFLEVAKLKALRLLWAQIVAAYGVDPQPVAIYATSLSWNIPAYEPHGNMLKATTAALSAVLGGCDALTIEPGEPGNALLKRIALNAGTIAREESRLGKVADPLAGSYYIDGLTDELAKLAWTKFQSLVSQ